MSAMDAPSLASLYLIRNGVIPGADPVDLPFTPFFGSAINAGWTVRDKARKQGKDRKDSVERYATIIDQKSHGWRHRRGKSDEVQIDEYMRQVEKYALLEKSLSPAALALFDGGLDLVSRSKDDWCSLSGTDRPRITEVSVDGKVYPVIQEFGYRMPEQTTSQLSVCRLFVEKIAGAYHINMLTRPVKLLSNDNLPFSYNKVRATQDGRFDDVDLGWVEPYTVSGEAVSYHVVKAALSFAEAFLSSVNTPRSQLALRLAYDIAIGDDFIYFWCPWAPIPHELVTVDAFSAALKEFDGISGGKTEKAVREKIFKLYSLDELEIPPRRLEAFIASATQQFKLREKRKNRHRGFSGKDEVDETDELTSDAVFEYAKVFASSELIRKDVGSGDWHRVFPKQDFGWDRHKFPACGVNDDLATATSGLEERVLKPGFDDERPFWVGQFFRHWDEDDTTPKQARSIADAKVRMSIWLLPTDDGIASIKDNYPQALPLVEKYRKVFDDSFPGWQSQPAFLQALGYEREDQAAIQLADYLKKRPLQDRLERLVDTLESFERIEAARSETRVDWMWMIRDASEVLSLSNLGPHCAEIRVGDLSLVNLGSDADGLPVLGFGKADPRNRKHYRGFDVGGWKVLQQYGLARSILTKSATTAGAVLADMAWQGHKRATVTFPGSDWHFSISLEGLRTIDDGVKRLQDVTGVVDGSKKEFRIQQHVEAISDQRLFIIDGKLVASTCRARWAGPLDNGNRRLDERLSIVPQICGSTRLPVPRTEARSDRAMAARFARCARKIARLLAKVGVFDVAIDLSETDDGIVVSQVISLGDAASYSLSHELLAKAFRRKQEALSKRVSTCVLDGALTLLFQEPTQEQSAAIEALHDNADAALGVFFQTMARLGTGELATLQTMSRRLALHYILSTYSGPASEN